MRVGLGLYGPGLEGGGEENGLEIVRFDFMLVKKQEREIMWGQGGVFIYLGSCR